MTHMHPEPAPPRKGHLESGRVAAYLDGALAPSDGTGVEAHLADCDACRMEVVDVARLVRARSNSRRWYLPAGAVAAAAAVLLLLIPGPGQDGLAPPDYREPVITTTVAPNAIAPRGAITAAGRLIWSSVPHADRYQAAVFARTGRVLWETQTSDTVSRVPGGLRFQAGASYHWQGKGRARWNRGGSSDL